MDAQPAFRVRFLRHIQRKHNFINVWGTIFGALCSVLLLIMLRNQGGVAWGLLLVALAFVGGRVWAVFMWTAFKSIYAIDEKN